MLACLLLSIINIINQGHVLWACLVAWGTFALRSWAMANLKFDPGCACETPTSCTRVKKFWSAHATTKLHTTPVLLLFCAVFSYTSRNGAALAFHALRGAQKGVLRPGCFSHRGLKKRLQGSFVRLSWYLSHTFIIAWPRPIINRASSTEGVKKSRVR